MTATRSAALFANWTHGPLAALPVIYRVVGNYAIILRRQYFFVGIVTAIGTVVAAEALRVNWLRAALVFAFCGGIFPAMGQLSDGQIDGLFESTVEFLFPYLSMGAMVFVIWQGIRLVAIRLLSPRGALRVSWPQVVLQTLLSCRVESVSVKRRFARPWMITLERLYRFLQKQGTYWTLFPSWEGQAS